MLWMVFMPHTILKEGIERSANRTERFLQIYESLVPQFEKVHQLISLSNYLMKLCMKLGLSAVA